MLLGEDAGGRHERTLQSVFRRKVNCRRGDHRFAGADVALAKAVHRALRGHVAQNVGYGAALRVRERKGQRAVKRRQVQRFAMRSLRAGTAGAQKAQTQRQQEQLLKHEAAARDGKGLLVRGKVDVFVGIADVAQLMGKARLLWQAVVKPVSARVQSLTDRPGEQ